MGTFFTTHVIIPPTVSPSFRIDLISSSIFLAVAKSGHLTILFSVFPRSNSE